jgi:phi LC3 family holin
MVNWQVRVKNRNFWLALIPACIVLAQAVAAPFGYEWDFGVLGQQLTAIVNAAFCVLSILGIVADPTTEGLGDSRRALGYTEPASTARHIR